MKSYTEFIEIIDSLSDTEKVILYLLFEEFKSDAKRFLLELRAGKVEPDVLEKLRASYVDGKFSLD